MTAKKYYNSKAFSILFSKTYTEEEFNKYWERETKKWIKDKKLSGNYWSAVYKKFLNKKEEEKIKYWKAVDNSRPLNDK